MSDHEYKILVIDDEPDIIEFLSYNLKKEGYEVYSAFDGRKGIEVALKHTPHLILLDIMMPGLDGFETCRRLKARKATYDIPVIFLTARADTVDKVRGFEIGAVDYIIKPFQYEEVIARLKSHLTIYRQRKEIERLREQDRLYYQKLSEIKDDVMNTASHDLKNPLSVIMTSLYLLERHGRLDDDRGRQILAAANTSAKQMRTLISDLLDLARIETGEGLVKIDVSLRDFLQTSLQSIALLAEQKRITLHFVPPEGDCVAKVDPNRMNQVLSNLLSNAVKYTPEGGQVKLAAEVREDQALIQVIDDGPGIPKEDLPRIFDKFFRVRSEEHLQQSGTGLGLSIAKSIVEQHGGEIWVESELGQGATFNITLPVR